MQYFPWDLQDSSWVTAVQNETILTVFVALTAAALLAQAGILLAALLIGRKIALSLREDIEELRNSAMPFIKDTRQLFDRFTPEVEPILKEMVAAAPNLKAISADVAALTKKARTQADGIEASAVDALERIRYQAARLDTAVTSLLDDADRIVGFLHSAVSAPARQAAGVLAAAKAIVESFRRPEPPARRVQPSNDHETFI
jgi:methyl-accepting chemotaxis protein